ncbi:MAG: glycosyltransferase family 4 protein [Solirubrobacteraceae bacterium]
MPSAVVVSPDPSSRSGGVERVCGMLAQALESHGWQTTIVGPLRRATRLQFRIGSNYLALSRSALGEACAVRPDVIVSNGYLGFGQRCAAPRVHLYHGTMAGGTRALAGLIPTRELIRRALSGGAAEVGAGRRATRIVCVSDATAGEVRRIYRLSGATVIPNAIDERLFAPRGQLAARERLRLPADGRYALFVGRFDPGKGGEVALAAARRAGHELLVAGRECPPGAHPLGIVSPERLPDAYAAADCVLLPSRYEACSMVVLEALACGRPLITTEVGWMRTLLRELPSYRQLCAPPSVEAVASRIEGLGRLDASRLTAEARAVVLARNGLARWSLRWHELLLDTIDRSIGPGQARPLGIGLAPFAYVG